MKQKKIILIVTTIAVCALGCKKEYQESTSIAEPTTTYDFSNTHACWDVFPEGVNPRGATIKAKQWTNGSTITVGFKNGTTFLKDKVKSMAIEWEQYANIKFKWVSSASSAQIRIEFAHDNSAWSYLGTDAKLISSNYATMHFGWFTKSTTDTEFSRTTKHEFGHALGMIHEHQHPTNSIPWDKEAAYTYYGNNGWSRAMVDQQVFNKYSTSSTNYSTYDKYSIMHYAIPNSITIGDYEVGWNTVLSSVDKAFIATVYPIY